MRIDSAGRFGFGTTSLASGFISIRPNQTDNNLVYARPTIQSGVTAAAEFNSNPLVGAGAALTSLNHFIAAPSTFTGTVTSQYGFNADSTLVGATNNYGFYGNIASGTGRYNFYAAGTAANVFAGTTSIGGTVGAESLRVTSVASAVNYWNLFGNTTAGGVRFLSEGSDTDVNAVIGTKGAGIILFRTGGGVTDQFRIAHTASAVNYLQVTGNTTGLYPSITATGSDATVGLVLNTKGGASQQFYTGNQLQFTIAHTASAVNYLQVTGAVTTGAPVLSAAGTDTNIDLALTPKGTGKVTTNGGLQISKTAVTAPAATDGNVFSGTYTPTLTNVTNVASSTSAVCQYIRVGDVVTVSGVIVIDPTATGLIQVDISLPIASNFANATNGAGTCSEADASALFGSVYASATNDRMILKGSTSISSAQSVAFSFTYRII
jgi:hypothetical protein